MDEKLLNWNRINATICFNYFQQSFYLVEPTMKTLAKGKSSTAIMRLLRVLLQTSQGLHGDFSADDETIADVAEVYEHEDIGISASERSGAHIMEWTHLNEWKWITNKGDVQKHKNTTH